MHHIPIGTRITDDNGQIWEKLNDGKWWKLTLAFHYDENRNQILDVIGGKACIASTFTSMK